MDEQEDAVSFWQLRDVRLAAVSGVFLAVGLAVTAFGAGGVAAVAFVGGLVVGGATFVPSSQRRLVHRQLGVGTLMTIAAIGA
ncbi:MAG: cation-transporting P-type ATPase, partial [Acidimicrobiia bacterium]